MNTFFQWKIFIRYREFRNFLFASSISLFGNYVFDISMPLYVLDKTHSALSLAMVTVALTLPYVLMAPFTGYIVDNFNKRNVMLFSDLGQVFCMIFMLSYDVSGQESIVPIVLCIFFTKTFMTLFETVATFQLVPALVSHSELASANAWFLSCHRLMQVLGPLTGGVLMTLTGVRSSIVLNMLSFSATLFFVFRMRHLDSLIEGTRSNATQKRPVSFSAIVDNFQQSIKFTWNSPVFKPFIILMFLWNLSSLCPNTPTLTYYFKELKYLSSAEYGAIAALIGFMGIVGLFWSSPLYQQFDFKRVFIMGCFWQAFLSTASIAFVEHPLVLAILFSLSRLGSSSLTLGTFLIRQTEVPKALTGGVNACLRMFFMPAMPMSALLQGYLITYFNIHVSLVLGALCLWGVYFYGHTMSLNYPIEKTKLKNVRVA